MKALERKIDGHFTRTKGGYERKISENMTIFVPDYSIPRYDEETEELYGYAPNYEALEAEKAPSKQAENPGEYSYYYEMEHAPTGCDFSAELSYYGEHYILSPLRDDLPRLSGRGITYDEKYNSYTVTRRAYEKIKTQYRIKYEMCFD